MRITNPKIPEALNPVDDFSSYAQEFLTEETAVSSIISVGDYIEDADFYKIELKKCVLEKCTFHRCCFENATFIDVIFRSCDFSNSKFTGTYFERCQFVHCKCVGVNLRDTVIKQTAFEHSSFQYSFFDKTQITGVSFDHVDFTEASMTEAKLVKFEAAGSRFIRNNFCKTMLTAVDFTPNEFAAPIVSSPPLELKGAVVDMFQAAELVKLWGVVVKQ